MVFKESEIYSVSMSNLADLTFEDVASSGRGYDENDPQHKTARIDIRTYPLCLYSAFKDVRYNTNEPNLRSISDVTRYSSILGQAILEKQVKEIDILLKKANSNPSFYVKDALDNTTHYTFRTSLKINRHKIATVEYVKSWVEEASNILQIEMTQLIELLCLIGLSRALNSITPTVRKEINIELKSFDEYFIFKQKLLSTLSTYGTENIK